MMMNSAIQKEIDELNKKNKFLQNENKTFQNEINHLKIQSSENPEFEKKIETLQKKFRDIIEDYEYMTKISIEFKRDCK